eukprot:2014189-Amphidinium_carterae.1
MRAFGDGGRTSVLVPNMIWITTCQMWVNALHILPTSNVSFSCASAASMSNAKAQTKDRVN